MSDLIVVAYPDINRAEQVLDALSQMRSAQLIDLEDACYVTKDANGQLKIHQAVNLPGMGAKSGAVWGGLWGFLFGLLVLQPLAGAAIGAGIGAGSGAIAGKLSDYGIDDKFIQHLSATLTPNSSAIFLLVRRVTADKVVPEFSRYGGTIIQTSLSKDAEAKLQAALAQNAQMQGMSGVSPSPTM